MLRRTRATRMTLENTYRRHKAAPVVGDMTLGGRGDVRLAFNVISRLLRPSSRSFPTCSFTHFSTNVHHHHPSPSITNSSIATASQRIIIHQQLSSIYHAFHHAERRQHVG